MTIEQTLMRSMKTIGGLAHGRGITDSTLNKWIQGFSYAKRKKILQEKIAVFHQPKLLW